MSFSDLYNFTELLDRLQSHDWAGSQCVALLGPAGSGKTRVTERFVQTLSRAGHYVLLVDSATVVTRLQVMEEAIVAAESDELVFARGRVYTPSSMVTITNSTVTGSLVSADNGGRRWFRRRRHVPVEDAAAIDGVELFPTLLDGIDRMHRQGWIVVDNADRAADDIRELVRMAQHRLRLTAGLRLLVVETETVGAKPVSNLVSSSATTYRVRPLTADEVRDWACKVGIDLSDEQAEVVHGITNGHAGEVFDGLTNLWTRRQGRVDVREKAT